MAPNVVRAILLDDGPAWELAARYGVSASGVRMTKRLVTKKARRAADELREEGKEPVIWQPATPAHHYSTEQVAHVRASGKPSKALAEEMGCSPALIRMIRTGKAYT